MAIETKPWKPLGKKHDWVEKGKSNLFFEIIIKDEYGSKIDRFVGNTAENFKKILEILRIKYGLGY